MSVGISIKLNSGLYIRDPQATKLGKSIIKNSILLFEEIGFEAFTFKKLATKIKTGEASIYRYFENKHYLFLYLVSWYWEWVSFLIDYNTKNIVDPKRKLKIIINNFVFASKDNPSIDYVNESILHKIIISEGTKAYHIKDIDEENQEGFFLNYKQMVAKVAEVISEVNPQFEYPRALASNLFEMANNHIYFAKHLPRLTDVKVKGEDYSEVEKMLEIFAEKLLAK